MNGYLLSVIGTILLSAILTALIPERKTAALVKAITRLVCVVAIISPVLNFLSSGSLSFSGEKNSGENLKSVIEIQEEFIEYYSEMRIREAEEMLKAELYEKYGLDTEVTLIYERLIETVDGKYASDSIKITQIRVTLHTQSNEEVLQKMWEYLTKNYCSEVLIE